MEPIITPRLRIRSLGLPDLPEFYAYRSDPEVTQYQGFDVMNEEQAEGFIKVNATKTFGTPGEWVQYGIEDSKTSKLIGDCALKLDLNDPDTAEIGITLSPLHQQKGYAKEVLLALLAFLFDKKGLRRVVEIVDAENTASINLLKSTGFRFEGHFIENIFFKGKWGSEFQYAMLKREWDAIKK
ncbi:MAG: GNAT family N-acetyltransferase [Kaistella sp.]|nr:GNAT family N-acetyltransferase [Kaistella sp.]